MVEYEKIIKAKIKVERRRKITDEHWLYWFSVNGETLFPSITKMRLGFHVCIDGNFSPSLSLKDMKVWVQEHLYLATYGDSSKGYVLKNE